MSSRNNMVIEGDSDQNFANLNAVFEENFVSRSELGAAVCVYQNGRKVVDLWGGFRDAAASLPWQQDTLVCMMSVGKGIAALAIHMLIDRGLLELEKPVAHYWPDFANAGKGKITVKQLLGGLAGLVYAEHAQRGDIFDHQRMVNALEKQSPVWPVGSQGAYHSMTIGFLLDQLVRLTDGRNARQFIQQEICQPLNVEYVFGITDAERARLAKVIPNTENATASSLGDQQTNIGKAWQVLPEDLGFPTDNDDYMEAVILSGNGVSNARSVARVYAMLAMGGAIDDVRLISTAAIERMRECQWAGACGLTKRQFKYGVGFFLNDSPFTPMGSNPGAFGHPGAGGAIGFADPENGLAFSYSPNYMCEGEGVGERCQRLIEALYQDFEVQSGDAKEAIIGAAALQAN